MTEKVKHPEFLADIQKFAKYYKGPKMMKQIQFKAGDPIDDRLQDWLSTTLYELTTTKKHPSDIRKDETVCKIDFFITIRY